MAEYNYEDDDLDFEGGDLVSQLRKQLKEAKRENRELIEALAETQSYLKESVVTSILDQYGLDPQIANFIPDEAAGDPDAVLDWLEEYGSLFGVAVVDDDDDYDYESDDDEYEYDESVAQAAERLASVEDGGLDPDIGLDLTARIESATSQEELMRILKGA